MLSKINIESKEFQDELEKTKMFANKVCESFNWVYNPVTDINEGVLMGLTRNKIVYNKRFCPCFVVEGETKDEQKNSNNRICPCKPAIEDEIPKDGKCHCGIFCTQDYSNKIIIDNKAEEIAHSDSRNLTSEECNAILSHEIVDSEELEALIESRKFGLIDFNLVDTREWMEWKEKRIVGTDYLVPTTSFYASLSTLEDQKEKPVILYCLTGSRSAYCQNVMKELGWVKVLNYRQGIIAYKGLCTSGE